MHQLQPETVAVMFRTHFHMLEKYCAAEIKLRRQLHALDQAALHHQAAK
jgi:hypothetical protein